MIGCALIYLLLHYKLIHAEVFAEAKPGLEGRYFAISYVRMRLRAERPHRQPPPPVDGVAGVAGSSIVIHIFFTLPSFFTNDPSR